MFNLVLCAWISKDNYNNKKCTTWKNRDFSIILKQAKDKIVYEKAWLNLIKFKKFGSAKNSTIYNIKNPTQMKGNVYTIFDREKTSFLHIEKVPDSQFERTITQWIKWSKYTWRQFRKYSWLINICRDANFNGHQGNTEYHIFMLSNWLRLKSMKIKDGA